MALIYCAVSRWRTIPYGAIRLWLSAPYLLRVTALSRECYFLPVGNENGARDNGFGVEYFG